MAPPPTIAGFCPRVGSAYIKAVNGYPPQFSFVSPILFLGSQTDTESHMVESRGTGETNAIKKEKPTTEEQYSLSLTTLKKTLQELQRKGVSKNNLVAATLAMAKYAIDKYGSLLSNKR